MSDTVTDAATATPADGFDQIGQELEQEGHLVENANPDDDPDTTEDAEDEGEKIALKVNGKTIHKSMKEVVESAQKYEATSLKLETAKKEIIEARAIQEKYNTQAAAIKDLIKVMQSGDIDTIHEFVDEKLQASEAWNKGVIDYVLRLWERSKMSPAQREAEENKKLLGKMRQQQEQQRQIDEKRAQEYAVNQWTQHIDSEVPKALTTVGLPDTQFVRSQVISTWRAALERGQNPTAAAVANYVKQQLEASKISFTGQQQQKSVAPQAVRPRATADTVRAKAQPKETSYKNWDDWIKSRGR